MIMLNRISVYGDILSFSYQISLEKVEITLSDCGCRNASDAMLNRILMSLDSDRWRSAVASVGGAKQVRSFVEMGPDGF